ncbi:MAG: esterase family protein [Parasporobacterium sp.]|nr:esterase family protein [Parasporobacterium sp.]
METQYFKDYSPCLERDMEMKVYGHAGKPVLFIPCQDGRFFDFENFKMTDVWGPWIESGRIMVFAIDTIDKETWSDKDGNADHRIWLHEQWVHYITDEAAPFIFEYAKERNGGYEQMIIPFGCSLGASHAVNLFLRRPDIFDGCLALSGIYTADYGFSGYMNDLIYQNSPVHYMRNMPEDHPYIEMYNRSKIVICVGQGPWEIPDTTNELDWIFKQKGIHAWVDFWGFDCAHDWDWWYKQVVYFVPYILGDK